MATTKTHAILAIVAGAQKHGISGWSPEDAMAMERRHIIEGEERIARQDVLTGRLIEMGYFRIAHDAAELLKLMYETLELSRKQLRYLEGRYGKLSNQDLCSPSPRFRLEMMPDAEKAARRPLE